MDIPRSHNIKTYVTCCSVTKNGSESTVLTNRFLVVSQVDVFSDLKQHIATRLQQQGWQLMDDDAGVRSIKHYLHDQPQHQTILADLCQQLTPTNTIALTRLEEAIPTVPIEPILSGVSFLDIEDIPNVKPQVSSFEIYPLQVPEVFREPLFGQPAPTAADIAYYGTVEEVPALKTYIVIDASRLTHGFTTIRTCNLRQRCLFKGEAAKTLEDVAPYLIELDAKADFTGTLLSYNPRFPDTAGLHLWHKEPGIYIRTRVGFNNLWNHLRKFTRIEDEHGKGYFLRYYDPQYLQQILASFNAPRTRFFFAAIDHVIYFQCGKNSGPQDPEKYPYINELDCGARIRIASEYAVGPTKPIIFDEQLRNTIGQQKERHFAHKLRAIVENKYPRFAEIDMPQRQQFINDALNEAAKYGISLERALGYFTLAYWLRQAHWGSWSQAQMNSLQQQAMSEIDKMRAFFSAAEAEDVKHTKDTEKELT